MGILYFSWIAVFVAFLKKTAAGSSKSKLLELREAFSEYASGEEGEFFQGSCELLTQLAKLETGADRLRTSITQGFACINDDDFKTCASAFGTAAKGRKDLEASGKGDVSNPSQGLEMLSKFCKDLDRGSVLDAMAWGRQALQHLEPEFNSSLAWPMFQHHFYRYNAALYQDLEINAEPPNAVTLYAPGLLPIPWHQSEWHLQAKALEENFERIGKEIDAWLANPERIAEMTSVGRTSCRQDALLVEKGDWVDIGLYQKGVMNRKLCWKYFPHTCNIVEKHIPEIASCPWGMLSISRLGPDSDTMAHRGNTNMMITLHLGIDTPKEAGLQVAGERREPGWHRGKATVFDDSFEHKVWHKGPKGSKHRTHLFMRFWHPDMTLAERLKRVESTSMLLPDWLKPQRMQLVNSSKAQERWKKVSKHFRSAVGVQ